MSAIMVGVVAYTAVAAIGWLVGMVLLWGTYQDGVRRRRLGQNGVISTLIQKRAVRYLCIGAALLLIFLTGINAFWPVSRLLTVAFLLAQPVLLGGYMVFDYVSDRAVLAELHRLEHKAKGGKHDNFD